MNTPIGAYTITFGKQVENETKMQRIGNIYYYE